MPRKKLRRKLRKRKKEKEPKEMAWWSVKLLFLMIGIYVLQLALHPYFTAAFALYPPEIGARPWTLVTAAFLHAPADMGQHLFYNMLALGLFGIILEKLIGSKKFLILFFTSAVWANIAGLFAYPDVFSLGASGAVMGIIGTLATLRPKLIVWFGGPMPLILAAVAWVFLDIIGFLSPTATGIGNAAHLAGMAVGIAFGFLWRKEFAVEKLIKKRISREFLSDEEIYS